MISTSAGEIKRSHAKNLATVHLLPDMNTLAPSGAFASFLTCMCDHGQSMSGGDTRYVSNAKVKAFFGPLLQRRDEAHAVACLP